MHVTAACRGAVVVPRAVDGWEFGGRSGEVEDLHTGMGVIIWFCNPLDCPVMGVLVPGLSSMSVRAAMTSSPVSS